MEVLLFTGVAIALYIGSDWLLRQIEAQRKAPLKQRQLIFFVIFFVLATTSFQLLQRALSS